MARVVVDAMGGDLGLQAVLEGVSALSLETNDIQMLLVGDADQINDELAERRHNPRKIQVVHAEGVVDMAEEPRDALTDKPQCSINVAMKPRFWRRRPRSPTSAQSRTSSW